MKYCNMFNQELSNRKGCSILTQLLHCAKSVFACPNAGHETR